jgi:hypothetical protein
MDTHHSLLPHHTRTLDAIEKRTASRLARALDAANFRDFMATKHAWAIRAFACFCVGTRAQLPKEILETEVEWVREDVRLGDASRERALDDLIELVQGLDAMLVFQAGADIDFSHHRRQIAEAFHRREFSLLLRALISSAQRVRLERELAHIVQPIWRFH